MLRDTGSRGPISELGKINPLALLGVTFFHGFEEMQLRFP